MKPYNWVLIVSKFETPNPNPNLFHNPNPNPFHNTNLNPNPNPFWLPWDNITWSLGLKIHWILWSETNWTCYFYNSALTFYLVFIMSQCYCFNANETLQLDFNSLNICDLCWYLIFTHLTTYLYTYLSLVSCSVNFDISWGW